MFIVLGAAVASREGFMFHPPLLHGAVLLYTLLLIEVTGQHPLETYLPSASQILIFETSQVL